MTTVTIQRKHLWLLVALILGAALLWPIGAWASHRFSDVPDSDWAHADIGWLADKGLTNGCGPSIYCPDDNVTRREVAAFTHRTQAALGTRLATGFAADLPIGADTDTLLETTYIDVPTLGGGVLATALVIAEETSLDMSGILWLEVNNDGKCDKAEIFATTTSFQTGVVGWDSETTVGAFASSIGNTRIDLCGWSTEAGNIFTAEIYVQWIGAGRDGGDFTLSASQFSTSSADVERLKESIRQNANG